MVEEHEKPVKYEDLDTYTRLCIENFRTLMKRELSLKKAENELSKWIELIPEKDMKGYVQFTQEIMEKYENEIMKIDDKMHERDVKKGIIKK